MKKIIVITICFLFIFEGTGYCLRPEMAFGRHDLSDLDKAMLGDMVDDPKAREAFPKVRKYIKETAYLYYAMKVYLYNPALFQRLVSEGIDEEIIDDIGCGLGSRPEAVERAIKNEIPFKG